MKDIVWGWYIVDLINYDNDIVVIITEVLNVDYYKVIL